MRSRARRINKEAATCRQWSKCSRSATEESGCEFALGGNNAGCDRGKSTAASGLCSQALRATLPMLADCTCSCLTPRQSSPESRAEEGSSLATRAPNGGKLQRIWSFSLEFFLVEFCARLAPHSHSLSAPRTREPAVEHRRHVELHSACAVEKQKWCSKKERSRYTGNARQHIAKYMHCLIKEKCCTELRYLQ